MMTATDDEDDDSDILHCPGVHPAGGRCSCQFVEQEITVFRRSPSGVGGGKVCEAPKFDSPLPLVAKLRTVCAVLWETQTRAAFSRKHWRSTVVLTSRRTAAAVVVVVVLWGPPKPTSTCCANG